MRRGGVNLRRAWVRHRVRIGLYGRKEHLSPLRRPVPPVVITIGVALLLGIGTIVWMQEKLRPMVAQAAKSQIQTTIVAIMDQAVAESLDNGSVEYEDLVSIQRNEQGEVISLTTDSGAMNQLRLELVSEVCQALDGIEVSELKIPLGSLLDSELVWARGPYITARALWVGSVSAEYESDFSSAGVNQTVHRIWLDLSVPVTVLLPGNSLAIPVQTSICIAETVIVGQVPQLYTWPADSSNESIREEGRSNSQ